MLNEDSLILEKENWFVALTQIKTGEYVKIPVPAKLVERLRALPFRGELEERFVLKTKKRSIRYGRKFFFWSGQSSLENNSKEWGEHIAAVIR